MVTDEPCPVFDNTEFAGPGSDESAGPVSEMPGSRIVNCTGLHSYPVESPHKSAASESDDCDSDGSDTPTHDFLEQSLGYWATTFSVSLVALKALLSILRVFHPKLPKDARTVLKSQVDVPTTKMDGGEYYHFGLAKGLLSRLKCLTLPTDLHTLKLQFNIDGLPLFRSSKVQFWPILALVNCDYSKSPFIVGLFCGISKPKSVFEYLKGGYNAVSCIQSCLHW